MEILFPSERVQYAVVVPWPEREPRGTARRRRAMRQVVTTLGIVGVVILIAAPRGVGAQVAKNIAAQSPWGPADEIGTLNMMTDTSRLAILKQIVSGKVYDSAWTCTPGCRAVVAPSGIPRIISG
jgi:hypothetical protein